MLSIHKNGNQMCNLCNKRIPKTLPRLNVVKVGFEQNHIFISDKICGKCIKEIVGSYKEEHFESIITWENELVNDLKEKDFIEKEKLNILEFPNEGKASRGICIYCGLEVPKKVPLISLRGYSIGRVFCGKCILRAYRRLPEKLHISEALYNKKMMVHKLGE